MLLLSVSFKMPRLVHDRWKNFWNSCPQKDRKVTVIILWPSNNPCDFDGNWFFYPLGTHLRDLRAMYFWKNLTCDTWQHEESADTVAWASAARRKAWLRWLRRHAVTIADSLSLNEPFEVSVVTSPYPATQHGVGIWSVRVKVKVEPYINGPGYQR